MEQKTIEVSVLLCKEVHAHGTLWVAQCLEYDIAAQGKGIRAAIQAIIQALQEQGNRDVESGKKPFEDFGRAPQDFWNQFAAAEVFDSGRLEGAEEIQAKLPPAWMIQAQEVRVC